MDWKARKQQLGESNTSVVRPIPRMDADILPSRRKHGGGPKKKYTPRKMMHAINRYFTWCEENDEVPSIKGMMIHLKMYKDAFYDYLKYPGFTEMMEHARMIIANWAEVDVYNTKGMAAGKIAYMKNIHGWADKLETQNFTEQRVITVDEARAKIESLAPKLLELLKSPAVVAQIGQTEDAEILK